MQKELKEMYPEWCKTYQNKNLVLSNDLDSLLSCTLLNIAQGYEINHYYTFRGLYTLDTLDEKQAIGVDMAIKNGMTWDNHVVKVHESDYVNPQSANINAILGINQSNYFDKFCGSTALQIYSYYGIPLPSTDEGKLLLLSIDSSHLGHYDKRYKETHNKYFEMLGFTELIDLLDRTNEFHFENVKVNDRLRFKDNIVSINQKEKNQIEELLEIKLLIPEGQFELIQEFDRQADQINRINNPIYHKDIFSYALTGRNYISYSIIRNEEIK